MTDVDRTWVDELESDVTAAFSDWDPFCQKSTGIWAITRYVDVPPDLPLPLAEARERLAPLVMDENTLENPGAPFNAPRYCLRSVEREVKRFGEATGCILEFGPSDYRTFLVTNGMDRRWAAAAGLEHEFESPRAWLRRWAPDPDACDFFANSFGINVLVSVMGSDHRRYFVFNERARKSAVRSFSTVGSADEGLRRKFGAQLFDQHGPTDPTPDLTSAVYRAVEEELGLGLAATAGTHPVLVSVGRVRSLGQPAALYYWPLRISIDEFRLCAAVAPDRHFEFTRAHFVPASLAAVVSFIRAQEQTAPVESWVAALAMYALQVPPQKSIFLSYSHKDLRFARWVGSMLKAAGHFVWLDEGELGPGDSLQERLAEAIHGVDFIIAILSCHSVGSDWVKFELDQALQDEATGENVKVLPLRKDDCEVPAYLGNRHIGDFRTRVSRARAIRQLLKTINRP